MKLLIPSFVKVNVRTRNMNLLTYEYKRQYPKKDSNTSSWRG